MNFIEIQKLKWYLHKFGSRSTCFVLYPNRTLEIKLFHSLKYRWPHSIRSSSQVHKCPKFRTLLKPPEDLLLDVEVTRVVGGAVVLGGIVAFRVAVAVTVSKTVIIITEAGACSVTVTALVTASVTALVMPVVTA